MKSDAVEGVFLLADCLAFAACLMGFLFHSIDFYCLPWSIFMYVCTFFKVDHLSHLEMLTRI